MEAIETIERAGFTAKLYQDESPSSPGDWDTLGILEYRTRDASVGELPRDFEDDCPDCDGAGELLDGRDASTGEYRTVKECKRCEGSGQIHDGAAICKRRHDAIRVLPIHASDGYGGTELSVVDTWEEANGWIYCTAETLKMTGVDLDDAERVLASELKEWQQWAQGDVYGVVVEDPRGEHVDSCWGFYGFDYAMQEAKEMLDIEPVRLLETHPELTTLKVC